MKWAIFVYFRTQRNLRIYKIKSRNLQKQSQNLQISNLFGCQVWSFKRKFVPLKASYKVVFCGVMSRANNCKNNKNYNIKNIKQSIYDKRE